MGVDNAPAWLVPAFVRSATALGATADREDLEAEAESLLEMWSSPDRHHHGVKHLVGVLEGVDQLAQETHNPDLVRLAGWYHGVVFDTNMVRNHKRAAGENKPESALVAERHLTRLGIDPVRAARVKELILDLTRHDPDPRDLDACALCDADLAVLAVAPQRYKDYRECVRKEFAHLPVRDYLEARIAIAAKLLAREHIFTSPLAQQWEEAARQNLEAELARLRVECATLPPREDGSDPVEETPPLRPIRPAAEDDSVISTLDDEPRHRAERFAKDPTTSTTLPAVASTGSLPRVPASPTTAEVAQVASDLGHIEKPSVAELRDADLGEDEIEEIAECIGIPYEEQEASRPAEQREEPLSAMEHDPLGPSAVPRRHERDTAELPRLVESADDTDDAPARDGQAADGPRPTVERISLRDRAAVSTDLDDDDASTGTLFRPVDL